MRQLVAKLAQDQILQQAGGSILAQANTATDTLSLLKASKNAGAEAAASASMPEMMEKSERAEAIEMKAPA